MVATGQTKVPLREWQMLWKSVRTGQMCSNTSVLLALGFPPAILQAGAQDRFSHDLATFYAWKGLTLSSNQPFALYNHRTSPSDSCLNNMACTWTKIFL